MLFVTPSFLVNNILVDIIIQPEQSSPFCHPERNEVSEGSRPIAQLAQLSVTEILRFAQDDKWRAVVV